MRFEAAAPLRIVHCHCVFCRRQTGGPVATFAGFKRSIEFTWSRGAPAVYRSSPTVRRSFCRACGSPLSYESARYIDEIYIVIGAFDEPDRLPPTAHVYVGQKISCFEVADNLPRFAGSEVEPALARELRAGSRPVA